jgi:fructokinase
MSVLVAGEALVDVVHRRDGAVDRHPGGSPANVAVGLARLDHDVVLATRIGDDEDGALLHEHLAADGVRLAPGSLVTGRTSTATAVLDALGAATYVFDLDWQLPDVDLAGVRHVHTGSIGAALPPGATTVRRLLARAADAGLTTSYDPNLRPGLVGTAEQERSAVEALVRQATVVKASDDDLAWLYAGTDTADPERAAAAWASSGPRLVVLTRGADGAIAWLGGRPDEPIALPAPRVDVLDTVGAGDAFMAGLLSGLLDDHLVGGAPGGRVDGAADVPTSQPWSADDVRPALRRALSVSSLTCARHGADPPRRSELCP